MARISEFIGRKYENLTILSYEGKQRNEIIWKCKCLCGKELLVPHNNLQRAKVLSCGCLRDKKSEAFKQRAIKRISKFIEVVNECWIWKGAKGSNNNPYTSNANKQLNPVRFFYEVENPPLSNNHILKKKCATPDCINFKHYELITRSRLRYNNLNKEKLDEKSNKEL